MKDDESWLDKISKALLLGCALAEATAIYGFVIGLLILFL